jgi:peptidoglycan/LPS O-acetylase OafA/YrhL
MRMSPAHSATAALCSRPLAPLLMQTSAKKSSRPFWYILRGALSGYTGTQTSPLFHYTLATRLAETKNRPSGFDYMRLILALGVIWSHSGLLTNDWGNISPLFAHISAPFVAFLLPMFFALSGFLVSGSLERSNTLVTFLGLRVFRIMPALTVEVFLSALVLGPLLTTMPLQHYYSSPKFRLYFLNVLGDIHYNLPGVFSSNPVTVVNGQLWTVPWELVCYIALAILAITGAFRKRRWLVLSLVGVYVVQIGLDIIKTNRSPWIVGGSSLVISFVAGLVLFRFRERVSWSGPLCLIMAGFSLLLFNIPHGLRFAAVPSAYVTVYLGLLNPPRNKLFLSGDYSYGLYLYGFPIQQAIVAIGPNLRHWYLNFLLSVPCAMLVAVGSWWLVEKPVLNQRKKLRQLEEWYLKRLRSAGLSGFLSQIFSLYPRRANGTAFFLARRNGSSRLSTRAARSAWPAAD